jgi:hypothetical protein
MIRSKTLQTTEAKSTTTNHQNISRLNYSNHSPILKMVKYKTVSRYLVRAAIFQILRILLLEAFNRDFGC